MVFLQQFQQRQEAQSKEHKTRQLLQTKQRVLFEREKHPCLFNKQTKWLNACKAFVCEYFLFNFGVYVSAPKLKCQHHLLLQRQYML